MINEESDKLLDTEQLVEESIRAVSRTASSFSMRSTRLPAAKACAAPTCHARRTARPIAFDRGHDGKYQARSCKNGPHFVHRSGRFPYLEAVRSVTRIARPLPIRVELKPLTRDDFRRILTEPEASLIKQYVALMDTEGVKLEFGEDAIDAIADIAVAVNASVENIGARRLQTVMERVLDRCHSQHLIAPAKRSRSTQNTCKSTSATWRRTPI